MIRTRYRQFSTINVTNLVDVTMTLLVIFMLAAPVIQRSAEITPPSTDQGSVVSHLDPGEVLIVEIDAYGNLSVSGEPVFLEDLLGIAEAAHAEGREEAFVRADRDVRYEVVANALTELGRSGYLSVGLIQESRTEDDGVH